MLKCGDVRRSSRHVAGTIFVLATATLLANLAIIVLRGYAFNLVAGWTQKENVIGLDGLSFSIMVALMWHITLFFLIVDLIFTLLLPSRDLQDGAVISFGIISIMQVPLVTFFLQNELSWSVQVWVINACNLANHADSCPAWWARIKVVSIASSSIVNALHLFLFGLAARYVHTRPATSQDMIARPFRRTHPFKHKSKSRRKTPFQPESGSLPPPTPTPLPTTYYSEESSDGGMPLRRTPSNRTSTTNPSAYPPPASPPFLSSSSDEEKQPLSLGRRASGRR
ncbi:hypothetical protein JCM11251_007268 [Rhodosporidiobolus azoricus]